MPDAWSTQRDALGAFLRGQRKLANLSLRELARLTDLSNAYLSQVERGMHEPSVRVLRSLAQALDLPPSTLLARAGLGGDDGAPVPTTEDAIRADPRLTDAQKQALIAVYVSYRRDGAGEDRNGSAKKASKRASASGAKSRAKSEGSAK